MTRRITDTALVLKIDCEYYNETMKLELLKVMKWFDANMMLLNVDKTKYIYFGPCFNSIKALHNVIPDYAYKSTLSVKDDYIEEDNEVKYLGIIFDNELGFCKEIKSRSMKINRIVGILWRCRDLPLEAKLTIYHSMAASHLNYGILVWGGQLALNLVGKFSLDHIPKSLSCINVAHNKCIRAITCSKRYNKDTKKVTHTAPLLKRLKQLSLNDIYYLNLALFAYDCIIAGTLPSIYNNYLTNIDNTYNTRACQDDVVTPSVRLDATYNSIKIASSYMWNLIPTDIRQTNFSKNVFKSKVKSWLISKY